MVDPTEALIQIQDKELAALHARVAELEAENARLKREAAERSDH